MALHDWNRHQFSSSLIKEYFTPDFFFKNYLSYLFSLHLCNTYISGVTQTATF